MRSEKALDWMMQAAERLEARGRLRAAWERVRIWAAVIRPSVDIRERVHLRQIASLIRQTNVMAITNLINSALITAVMSLIAWVPLAARYFDPDPAARPAGGCFGCPAPSG